MKFIIAPLSPVERLMFTQMVIGKTTCPHCKQTDVKVLNKVGANGDERSHYLENHHAIDSTHNLCLGSEKFLADITMTVPNIPVGTPIIYYNKWTGFETELFRGQFEQLTAQEILFLVPGSIVYVDVDPLHQQGKVYGRIKAVITDIQMTGDVGSKEYRISWRGGHWSGSRMTQDGLCSNFDKAVDEEALAKIIASLPLSTVIN